LHRGIDTTKDQSYFLWTLTDEQLQMTLLPVGGSTKKEIRSEAQNAGLLTAEKSDSQGICFLGHVDIPSFLSHYIELKPGAVVDEAGKQIGTHGGALVYTLGQRHGFFIDDTNAKRKPHYVIERNIEKSVIVVSTNKPTTRESKSLVIGTLNYINWKPKIGAIVEVQTRYRQTPTICTVTELTPQTLTLTYNKEGEAAPVGQSCVLYEGKRLLGGGIIQ
jgi:tRNA-specific 2-thiouridylase